MISAAVVGIAIKIWRAIFFTSGFFGLTWEEMERANTGTPGLTPTHKLQTLDPDKENIVLFSVGSFSPVHYNHVDMLETAKRSLEQDSMAKVVGGYLCPSADLYLKRKLCKKFGIDPKDVEEPPNFISGRDRAQMIDLLVADNGWIMCDRYESFHGCAAREAKDHLVTVLEQHYGVRVGPHLKVVGVGGVDALANIKSEMTVRTMIFVVNRQSDDGVHPLKIVEAHPARHSIKLVWADDWDQKQVSSTDLRRFWAEDKDISSITHPRVIQFMKDFGIKFRLEKQLVTKSTSTTEPPAAIAPAYTLPQVKSSGELTAFLRKFYEPKLAQHRDVTVPYIAEAELGGPGIALGAGLSGTCFLRTWNEKPVAVKVVVLRKTDRISPEDQLKTLAREAILQLQMQNPFIPTLYGCGIKQPNEIFMVFSFAGKETDAAKAFAKLVETETTGALFPSEKFLLLLRDIAFGMAYVHNTHAVVHRDMTLQNILITDDGHAQVADWGQAKEECDDLRVLRGSCRHYPPESLERPKRGQAPYKRAADVFMFGALMYEAASGRKFWHDLDTPGAVQATLSGKVPQLIREPGERQFDDSYIKLMSACMHFSAVLRPTFDEIVARINAMVGQT